MYKKILVPMALDHGLSSQTLQVAQTLLSEGGEIIALHVHEAPSSSVTAYLDEEMVQIGIEKARKLMAEKLAGTEGVTPVMVKGHSARSIIDYANSHDIDCIAIGSHRPGLSDYFLGSTAARVVRFALCAVHVLRTSD